MMARKWAYEREKEKKSKIWNHLHEEDEKTEDMVWRAKWGETKLEKYPYRPNTGQKVSGHTDMITLLTHQPDYTRRAAAGWAQHQSDQAHRQAVLRDPGYQKWQQATGSAIEDDEDWHPKEDWDSSQNNHFGYLYSKNPWEARSYATLVNRENRWGKEIGSQQVRTGMPKKTNFLDRAADFLTDAWNRNAQAESVNSGMSMEQGLKTGEKARKVFDSAGQAMAAQSEMNRQAADGAAKEIKEQTKKAAKHWGDANAAYSEAQTEQANKTGEFAERTKQHWVNANKSYSEAYNEHAQRIGEQAAEASRKYGEMWVLTSGVTGSDQTGASVWGYRKDKQMSEPRSDWDVAARKEYRTLKRTDPKAAEAFAVEVNEGLNRAERERRTGALQEWVSESGAHGVAAWIGGRGLNQISPLDSYNESLERAAIGVNREKSQLTATDIKEIIDDTNAGNIEERFGKLGSLAYRGVTWLADSKVSEKMFSQKLLDVGEKSVTVDDVLSTIDKGVKAKKIVTGTKEWFEANKETLDSLTEVYKEKGMSERKARYKATRELLEDSYKKDNGKK